MFGAFIAGAIVAACLVTLVTPRCFERTEADLKVRTRVGPPFPRGALKLI